MIHRMLFVLLAVSFVGFALLQYNDPDPFVWCTIYLVAALFHVGAALQRFFLIPTLCGTVLSFGGAILYWPAEFQGVGEEMSTEVPHIELARESLGLMIISFSFLFLVMKARSSKKELT